MVTRVAAALVSLAATREVLAAQQATPNVAPGDSAPRDRPPTIVAGRDGFALRSADGDFVLRLRGYFQSDARVFPDDGARPLTSTILTRRIRPVLEGTLWRYVNFRLMPDFAGGSATLFDANVDLQFRPAVALRVGKFKPPIGLERLQSATDLLFVERGLPTNLVPSRDLGVQLFGDIADATLSYAVGVFDGAPDLGVLDGDNADDKDVAGRVFLQPFRTGGAKSLRGLGLGFAVSTGIHNGGTASPFLPVYRSLAQQPIFSYRTDGTASGTVLAGGRHRRLSPQGYFYTGPIGLMAEYVRSSQTVARGTTVARLDHDAWQVAGTWVLTGEAASFRSLEPAHPFHPGGGAWGAFSVGARYGRLLLDSDAFPLFADPATEVAEARAWGVAVNWFLARGIRVQLNYEQTEFDGGAATGDRPTERAILARVQHAF
jgi:phosphate-selective porin OprO and OprP